GNSEVPALRVGDEEISENLNTCDRLEFFRINKISIERERVGFAEQLNQAAVFLDQIVRQHCDTESALARAQHAENVVDRQMRRARIFAVATDLEKPAPVLQVRRHHAAAEKNNAMLVEFVVRAWRAESLEVIGRRIGVEMHREELAL